VCDEVSRDLAVASELFVPILGEAGGALADAHSQRQAQDRALAELAQRSTARSTRRAKCASSCTGC
jgi:hypothetical protein